MLAAEMDTGHAVPLWFTVPGQLHHVDLDEDPEQRIKRSYENVATTLGGATAAEQVHVVFLQELMLSQLLSQGAVYVGHCVARSEADPSKLTTAQFSLLVKEADLAAHRPLAAVASALRQPDGSREVGFADYPAGEALVVGEEVEVQLPTTVTGKPVENTHRVRQAQVILPFPGNRRMVVIGVSSEGLDDWEHYVAMLNEIASSISFTDPAKKTIGDRLAGL